MSLRRLRLWPLLTGLVLALAPAAALATPIVSIVWTATTGSGATGSNVIEARPGDLLTAQVRLSPDSTGVSSYGISLRFDTDLADELDLLGAVEFLPPGFSFVLSTGVASTQESELFREGHVFTCEAVAAGNGPTGGTFSICQLDFRVTANVVTDGADLFTGLFNSGVDGIFDNAGNPLSPDFATASVVVPEPGTAALLLLGLAALRPGRRRGRGTP
jgi:hypothetical protein